MKNDSKFIFSKVINFSEQKCERCGGSGDEPCKKCKGKGEIICPKCNGAGGSVYYDCDRCNNTGYVECDRCYGMNDFFCEPCIECGGTGHVIDYSFRDILTSIPDNYWLAFIC